MNSIKMELAAPSVEGVLNGELDPDKVDDDGALMSVLEVPGTWSGLMMTLYLRDDSGAVLWEQEWKVGPHGLPVTLPIPRAILVANTGKDVAASYSVETIGDSHPLPFKLGQGFSGEVAFDLSQHQYIVIYTNSEARPPKEPPAFTRMQRALPGATAYSSSDEKVARVDNLGNVTALCNGVATISASGAPSGPASYRLTIKGIDEWHMLSSEADWAGADRLCRETNLELPRVWDFDRLKMFYPLPIGSDLNLPNYEVWGTAIGSGTANIYHLDTGVADGLGTDALLQVAGVLYS